ncbi:MAG TPA: Hpt domain-containing protein [Bacteroidia bacterium]|jgi:HPt (histidine-containing phosphotransfer) domain-containing protein
MGANHKHIDLDYLKQISNGSNEFIFQMITVFTEEIPGEIENLEKHLANKDWKALRATAHKMKPSYSFMGVKQLEEMVNSIEEFSEAKQDVLPGLVQQVRSITDEVVLELQEEKKNFQ